MIKHRLQLKRIQRYSRETFNWKKIKVNRNWRLILTDLFWIKSYLPVTRDVVIKLLDIFKIINKINIDIKDYNTRLDYIEAVTKEMSKKWINPYDSRVIEELEKMANTIEKKDLHNKKK